MTKRSSQFVPPHPLKTPVLFLVFNRLETTIQVFEVIREVKPPRLYISADGPREYMQGESEKVQSVRDFIIQSIDWECEVRTLFNNQNLGCKYAVSNAITWFFENEEQGIILEDDCLPSHSFFWFCEELLTKYKDDLRVWHVSGTNLLIKAGHKFSDYYFSKFNLIWGWASWANRWKNYDVEIDSIQNINFIEETFNNKESITYWRKIFEDVKKKKIDTWDYQYTFSMWDNGGLAIIPSVNLISNIGFGKEATHTKQVSELSEIPREEISLKNINLEVVQNIKLDDYVFNKYFLKKSLVRRILDKL